MSTSDVGGTGVSGGVTLSNGTASSGTSGSVVVGSDSSASGSGGAVSVSVGSGDAAGGTLSASAGDSSADDGGAVQIASGSSQTNSGGAMSLAAGQGNTFGGALSIDGGLGSTDLGGAVAIKSGSGAATSSGSLTMATSDAGGTGMSGQVTLSTSGTASGASGIGTSGAVGKGSGSSASGSGGAVSIGTGSGDGADGSLPVSAGDSSADDGGAVQIPDGTNMVNEPPPGQDRSIDDCNTEERFVAQKDLDDTAERSGLDVSFDEVSEADSEASMMALMRYVGCSSRAYGQGPAPPESEDRKPYKHDLVEGDHVIRWKMLGFCYPIQVHGIVFSAGPDVVTIVDCGLASSISKSDIVGTSDEEQCSGNSGRERRKRMDILTLVDEKEIKKWTKISYGKEVELRVASAKPKPDDKSDDQPVLVKNDDMQRYISNQQPLEGKCSLDGSHTHSETGINKSKSQDADELPTKAKRSWFWSRKQIADERKDEPKSKEEGQQKVTLPKTDPPFLVLARLRFLLEQGEEAYPPSGDGETSSRRPLMPPHHLLYANSECIAVWCKTGHWSTLQASIFLHSSTVGNVKQTATLAAFLSAQTVTVPASGFWGWFGGTTTVGLFTAQPYLVPALIGGGMVYVGIPVAMYWKAKGRWSKTEARLNDAFWSSVDCQLIVELIRCWSCVEDPWIDAIVSR